MDNTNNKTSRKILIIDDDKFLRDMYSIKFGENGYEVTVAQDGEDALEKFEQCYRADIYLIDMLMPRLDGFQLITQMKQKQIDNGSVVIILSNLGQKEDMDKGLGLGVDGYIIKASATPSEVVQKTIDIASGKLK